VKRDTFLLRRGGRRTLRKISTRRKAIEAKHIGQVGPEESKKIKEMLIHKRLLIETREERREGRNEIQTKILKKET